MATAFYCRQCGTQLLEKSSFCPTCGASQSATNHNPTSYQAAPINMGTGRLPAGQMLHQRYRLLQTVGQGGMGAVYLAQDTQLGDRLVAVKEMSMSRLTQQELPQAVEQFRREAHLLASLHHPNLPIIYEYFSEGDRWYLVMSFIEGGTLQNALDETTGKRLSVNDVVRITLELCDVLSYLHNHQPQVIFRDLKPANIMITPKGTVYLIDFGIARHFKQEQSKDTAYYYSVGYAPPEQYGQSQTSPRSDIYSLGATLHQMLSGHNPGSKPFQFPNLQLIDPTIPVELANLIAQMLEMNEQQRPASMEEVKALLEKTQRPTQLPPTIQADNAREVKAKEAQNNSIQQNQTSTEPTSDEPKAASVSLPEQNEPTLWKSIDRFLSKRRVLAWLCLIVLSLVMAWPISWTIIRYDTDYYGTLWQRSAGTWFLVASIGTIVVSLIFLLRKGRPRVDVLGGIAFTLLGYCAFLAFLSQGVYTTLTEVSFPLDWLSLWLSALRSYISLIFLFSLLLLFIGVRFFLRGTSGKGGTIFGVLLIGAGIIIAFIVQSQLGARYDLPLTTLLWIYSARLGLSAISASHQRRGQPGKQRPTL